MTIETKEPGVVNLSHDALQQDCYEFLHNSYPNLRKLFWAVNNETKPYPGETKKRHAMRINRLKAIGLVKGVYDFHFYHAGKLYVFDFKVGPDKLSEDQKRFGAQVESQGGRAYVIRSLAEFKSIIREILCKQDL